MSEFKLTYSTMFSPPPALHDRFEVAVGAIRERFGKEHPFFIDGKHVFKDERVSKRNPADQRQVLGEFSLANVSDVDAAVAAARKALPAWRGMPWQERIKVMRRVSKVVESHAYEIAAAISYEMGKNRMEALGEVGEVVDFFELAASQMEANEGYSRPLPNDPVEGFISTNRSVLKPYGVWAVIVPFNFPFALAGGPVAYALTAGNTVVMKGATETPWSGVWLAECLREAGVPDGVFNYVLGQGSTVGKHLAEHDGIDGITFTGSHEIGMQIFRAQVNRFYPRPCVAELGGKNAVLVTADANLEDAAQGIVRSAFGMTGQKCSALSRVYAVDSIADALIGKIAEIMRGIVIGDPQARETWLGPIATDAAFARYARYVERLSQEGARIVEGGRQRWRADLEHGLFCEPVLAEAPLNHPLWEEEMFAPIVMLGRVKDKEQGMQLMNDSPFGLTAGFYGSTEDAEWFFDNIEVGVAYSNRPQGATTGAWPGYQPFAGWKGSGSTGKALASFHYLPQYMREQSQTRVVRPTSA